jgi:TonB-dependent SusC/RagA subfamily outer membrane receptor
MVYVSTGSVGSLRQGGSMIRLEKHCHARVCRWHRCVLLAVLLPIAACSPHPPPSSDPAPQGGAGRPAEGRAGHSLDSTELKADGVQSVEQLIQGHFPGVQVIRLSGGGFSLRIRGAGSLMGRGDPLYVVDGMALPPAPGGALVGVDPRDIERIEVLKDVSATSAYGVRGANGVILIRTKRGR